MLINEEFVISKTAILNPKKPPINWTKYKRNMPPVAAATPSLKFSVTLMSLDL